MKDPLHHTHLTSGALFPSNPFELFPWVESDLFELAIPLLSPSFEDRQFIRDGQDLSWLKDLSEQTTQPFPTPEVANDFVVAPMDILVERHPTLGLRFSPIELNGTGIGGLTNLPLSVIKTILKSFEEQANHPFHNKSFMGSQGLKPVVLIGISGQESDQNPRVNRLAFEKFLYADAFVRGFKQAGWDNPQILTLPLPSTMLTEEEIGSKLHGRKEKLGDLESPVVIVGYLKSFFPHLTVNAQSQLVFEGYPVTCIVNDRLIQNLLDRFVDSPFETHQMVLVNGCFGLGSDKGIFYQALQNWILEKSDKNNGVNKETEMALHCPDFEQGYSIDGLVEKLETRWAQGHPSVIKPQGTGLGHGIEFFTEFEGSFAQWMPRIYASPDLIARYYDIPSQGFPYLVTDFIDCDVIRYNDHPFEGHKYELRIVLYRDGQTLKVCPSTVKLSSFKYDPDNIERLMLINNITAASGKHQVAGSGFLLPLGNPKTLELLQIPLAQFSKLCEQLALFGRDVLTHHHTHREMYRTRFPSLLDL